jgi:hypothetical protein
MELGANLDLTVLLVGYAGKEFLCDLVPKRIALPNDEQMHENG